MLAIRILRKNGLHVIMNNIVLEKFLATSRLHKDPETRRLEIQKEGIIGFFEKIKSFDSALVRSKNFQRF